MRQTFSTINEDETSSRSSKKQDDSSSSIKSLSIKYALSSLASAVAETGNFSIRLIYFLFSIIKILIACFNLVTYPLDIVKTRLQIQDELIRKDIHASNRVSHGMFGVGLNIGKLDL